MEREKSPAEQGKMRLIMSLNIVLLSVALKQALMVENKLDSILHSEEIVKDSTITSISDGIRMVAYTITTMQKINELKDLTNSFPLR